MNNSNNTDMMMGTAVILTKGLLALPDAKTAHGLIRGTDRFKVVAVIDEANAGRDAGEVLDGNHREIPVFSTIDTCVAALGKQTRFCHYRGWPFAAAAWMNPGRPWPWICSKKASPWSTACTCF